jgi:hypothetical protein
MFTDFGNSVLNDKQLYFTKTSPPGFSVPWTVGVLCPLWCVAIDVGGNQAPELLHESTGYSVEADVYALGMVRSPHDFA